MHQEKYISKKQCLCGIILYGLLPPQASRPELHGQANAGKKRDKALELLSAWLPDVEKFSKEIGKQQAYKVHRNPRRC